MSTVENDDRGIGTPEESEHVLLARVSEARGRLAAAAATGDAPALSEALDALEDALAAAHDAGVDVPPAKP